MPLSTPLSNTVVAAVVSRSAQAGAGTRHRRTYVCWLGEEDWYVEFPSTVDSIQFILTDRVDGWRLGLTSGGKEGRLGWSGLGTGYWMGSAVQAGLSTVKMYRI